MHFTRHTSGLGFARRAEVRSIRKRFLQYFLVPGSWLKKSCHSSGLPGKSVQKTSHRRGWQVADYRQCGLSKELVNKHLIVELIG